MNTQRPHDRVAMALTASAVGLALLLALQIGRLIPAHSSAAPGTGEQAARAGSARSSPDGLASLFAAFEPSARADVVSQVAGYTVLTFDGGSEDVLLVLDSRAEELFTYMVRNQNKFEYLGREDLRALFAQARAVGTGIR